MSGKQWALIIVLALLFLAAPKTMVAFINQALHSLLVFLHSLNMH